MILVAACPGGNVSNFYSSVAGGNVALSVTLTAIATISATIMTPVNFEFWSGLLSLGKGEGYTIKIAFWPLFRTMFTVLALPLVLGLVVNNYFPSITKKVEKPIRIISFLMLAGFVIFALNKNFSLFLQYGHLVIFLVLVHNAIALATGFFLSRFTGGSFTDSKTIAIETGIQNSGLGLVIIFTLLEGNGGMAIITAWWGVWHLVSGFAVSMFFQYRTKNLALQNGE